MQSSRGMTEERPEIQGLLKRRAWYQQQLDAQVREEYRWVPDPIYRAKRKEVLAGFLARPVIYGTERFRERFEVRARENLRRDR